MAIIGQVCRNCLLLTFPISAQGDWEAEGASIYTLRMKGKKQQ